MTSVNGQNWTGRIQHLVRKVMAASPRPLEGGYRAAAHLVAATLAAFFVYTAGFGVFTAESHRALFLAGTQILVFLWFPARYGSPRGRFSFVDGLLAMIAVLVAAYFIWEYPTMVRRAGLATPNDVALGVLAIVLSLEAARRVVGPVVPLVAICSLLFAWRELAPYLPGTIAHRGFTAERMIMSIYMSLDGLFGIVTYTFATHVFLFVIFGAFLERSGVGRFFIELPYALMGRSPGGAGKVAVAASALLGSVTGSPTANTAAMGTFTIPLMKRSGYAGPVAAGIETAASIGSQFLPPVMGAAAFFMVEFTGIPYIEVVKIAAIPALIYYVGVMAMVHFQARRDRMQGAQAEELPDWRRVLQGGWYLALPLVVLLGQYRCRRVLGHSHGSCGQLDPSWEPDGALSDLGSAGGRHPEHVDDCLSGRKHRHHRRNHRADGVGAQIFGNHAFDDRRIAVPGHAHRGSDRNGAGLRCANHRDVRDSCRTRPTSACDARCVGRSRTHDADLVQPVVQHHTTGVSGGVRRCRDRAG
jgi:TRAP-type uncharacterized transport system fused permease subunit